MFNKKIIPLKLSISKSEVDSKALLNQGVKVFVSGKSYIVFKQNNAYIAVRNNCPHQNKPLEGAKCIENSIICPYHQYKFDTKSGKGHGMFIDIYQVISDGNQLTLLLPKTGLF